jgi:glycerol-3-phosphate dehydrogenase (NAD(P)+)
MGEGTRCGVVGCGGWGTALAKVLAERGHAVTVWGYDEDLIPEIGRRGENERYLAGVQLPPEITWTTDLATCVGGAAVVVMATPTPFLRSVCERVREHLGRDAVVVTVAKGIEEETLALGSGIVGEVCGAKRVAGLFGPSHAEEVARRMPTTIVATSRDAAVAERVQGLFFSDYFRVYTNPDMLGVELGAALKNVIAIAAGICDGMGLGDNAKSALICRGLAEIARLGVAMGADARTFAGLTGLGDLITTCISPHGRNLRVGRRIGAGETLTEVLASMRMVAEGVRTSRSARALAAREGVEMPITEEVYRVLFEDKPPREALHDLMTREPKAELDQAV